MIFKTCLLSLLTSSLVAAQGQPDKGEGHYIITVGNRVYESEEIRLRNLPCTGTVTVRGLNNGFDIECATLNLYNYYFTGAQNGGQLFNKTTTVFTSRTLDLTPQQLGTPSISELRLRGGRAVIRFATGLGGEVKYQFKDNTQGGVFQTETEYPVATNVTHTITLAPDIFYFFNANMDNAVRMGNGIPAHRTHVAFVGKDSPQGANRLYQDGHVSQWNVWSGGRMGAVFGEDALEDAPPATVCTSDCQAQNQIRGSLPVTELPDTIIPIGEEDEEDDD
ncbi:hypothetical protein B0I35DRAFT_459409 [Stachybotrys elegans]|uniref:Uncharacterized protein n=1 Tax=Stachybotrys elegans TaxID=80388 RepID=A0A8K0SYP4_9HYPO|nr:hypothetical protein B0I35DRAFT_459409 [Stachybotrys elegans]